MRTSFILGLSVLALCSLTARADDPAAKAKYDSAQGAYFQRGSAGKVDEALAFLAEAEALVVDADLKYDILILESACYYWQGTHAIGDKAKMVQHDLGYKRAEAAREVNGDYADGLYWSAANLARWGEANGVIASLGKKKEIEKTLNGIFDRNTKHGLAGETYWHYGADRIMMRVYFKAPPFAGGSLAMALKHGEKAYQGQKNFVLTVMWYAEALYQSSNADKQKARDILDELLAKNPNTLLPGWVPETLDEWPNAQKLRAEMGNE